MRVDRQAAGGDRSSSSELYRLLGEAYRGEGELVKAKAAFDTCIRESPKAYMGYISRSRCLLDMAEAAEKELRAAQAETAGARKSELGQSKKAKAGKKGKKGKKRGPQMHPLAVEAMADLKKATKLGPGVAMCWNELGAAKRKLGLAGNDGFTELSMSIKLDAGLSTAFLNRAPLHAAKCAPKPWLAHLPPQPSQSQCVLIRPARSRVLDPVGAPAAVAVPIAANPPGRAGATSSSHSRTIGWHSSTTHRTWPRGLTVACCR